MSTMRLEFAPAQRGFGLVAALFLILVIAGVIAAMARLTDDSEATSTSAPVSRSPASEKARAMASRAALL